MRQRELRQGQLLQRVTEGQLPLRHAAAALGVGYRQAKRLLARFRAGGPAALAHGNRGRCPPNRLPEAQRRRILALSQDQYHDCNDAHFAERLAADHGLLVSRDLVRRLRRGAGLPPKRRRRPKQHHGRRPRRSLFGAMMLWDGSPHRWFGPDRPPCCLMAAIDDATSRGGTRGQYIHFANCPPAVLDFRPVFWGARSRPRRFSSRTTNFCAPRGRPAPAPQFPIGVRPEGAESGLNRRNHEPVFFDCQ